MASYGRSIVLKIKSCCFYLVRFDLCSVARKLGTPKTTESFCCSFLIVNSKHFPAILWIIWVDMEYDIFNGSIKCTKFKKIMA
jgi:hypothetical protein